MSEADKKSPHDKMSSSREERETEGNLCLTIDVGQHIEMPGGAVMYVSRIDGQGRVRLAIRAPRSQRFDRTAKYGPTGCSKEEFKDLYRWGRRR